MLDFVQRDYSGHKVVPARFAAAPAGMVLAFVVDAANADFARFQQADVPIVMDLRDEPLGRAPLHGPGSLRYPGSGAARRRRHRTRV